VPASVEVKLVDCPELNYLTSTDPPQGEVFIRGGAVTEGYLNNVEENAKAFENGWFKTGDIGEFDRDGRLKIIDRRKNLVKTLNGEYIALEKVRHYNRHDTSGLSKQSHSSRRATAQPSASQTSASTPLHNTLGPSPYLVQPNPFCASCR
jgi:hypothetical protein